MSEKEWNEILKEDIENMEDDNIVNEIAYYLYEEGKVDMRGEENGK